MNIDKLRKGCLDYHKCIEEGYVDQDRISVKLKDRIGVKCIICNGLCELDEGEKNALRYGYQVVKVCDDCKRVVLWMKDIEKYNRPKRN